MSIISSLTRAINAQFARPDRARIETPKTETPKMQRLNTCQETGRDLSGVDLHKHAATLWPNQIPAESRYDEARKRRDAILREAALRAADTTNAANEHEMTGD